MKFADSHEWILIENGIGMVGLSDYGQKELGEIVFVKLPEVGKKLEKGEELAIVESTKAAADIYAPVSGSVVEINEKLATSPELLNTSSEKEGWLVKISLDDPAELNQLLEKNQYLELIS